MTLHRAGIYNLSRLVPVPSEARLPLMPRWAHPPFTLLTLLPAVLLCLAAGAHAQQGSVATDTAALQALYNSTDGANWTDNTNWTSDMALSTWHGVTTNGDGRVTRLELQENGLNGTLPTELENLTHLESLLLDRNYALMGPLPDGLRELLALATVDLTDTELCAPEDAAFKDWTATISSFSGLTRAPTEESVIDVAVFYTPQAREAQDGHDQIRAKIDLMVAETNRAYTDSGVDQRINPVVVEEVAYTETSLLTDIVHLKGPSDGHMDEVHAIRDRVWADIVMLIRARGGGQAVTMLTESTNHARNAFGLSGAHTGVFAHELGHIMGLKHDRYEECDASRCNSALSADAYGYVNQRAFDENAPASSRWRTIMAYNSQCGRDGFNCQWLLRFSNSNQLYPDAAGDPLGVALTSDNEDSIAVDGPANAVRVLNETRDTVADFRQGRAVKVFFDAGPYSVTEGGTVTVTVRLDAAPGRTLNIPIPLTANSLDGAWAGDYAMPSSIIFGSNQTEQTFSLTVVNDTVQENEETVTLGFGEPLPAGVTVGSQATATVTLTDTDTVAGAPSVAEIAITSEPGAAYAAGEEVEVTVIFTRPVTVTGTPGLGLTIGTTTRPMVYQDARSASEVLVFAYTVADGESDTDGVSIPENSLEGTIRDSANQDAAILTHAAVDADHTVDGVTPELDTAAADGAVVTLTFDEVLDETSIPAEDAFTVTAAGATLSVDSVEVSEMVVTLTLGSHVVHGQVVRLDYTPGTKPLQDLAGNAADPLSNTVVTNETAMPVYDTDRDGLIEITTLAQLDAMRHDPDGDGIPVDTGTPTYATAFPAAGARLTCGVDSGCAGYELTVDLDFDTDEDGQVDADDTYWNNGVGWVPIGTSTDPFATTFEGNGHTIRYLFIDRNTDYVGLFGRTEGRFFVIRHVALTNVQVTGDDYVGGLVGRNDGGLLGSYVTGQVSGHTYTGGLVGYNDSAILGSYATGQVSGHSFTGGLVGYNALAIVGSYATGRVWGSDRVGGFSGTSGRSITASYATGRVSGRSNIGGLVGLSSFSGTITSSYWDTTTSSQSTGDGGAGQSTAALQAPTDYSGIYADWNVDVDGNGTPDDPWDLGTASQYPVLKADLDGDGTATWQEFGYQLRKGPTLTARAGVGQVVLEWTAVEASHWDPAPAVTYTLYRDDGATVEAMAENLSGLGYTDTDVTAGATYVYQVAAVVNGGEGSRSPRVSVEVPMPGVLPTVTLELSPASISENGGSAMVTAKLSHTSSETTTVTVSATANSPAVMGDFTLSANRTLTIAAGQANSTGTVTIRANNNNVHAPDKTVRVSGSASNSQGVTNPGDVTLTIVDDDTPTVTLELSQTSISENGGSTTVTARLSNVSSEMTTVTVSATAVAPAVSRDFTLTSNKTLMIMAGHITSTGTVTITANDNDVDTPDKTVRVSGMASTSLGVMGPAAVTLTLTDDDDAPAVTLELARTSINENRGFTTVRARLNRASSETTTVSVSATAVSPAVEGDFTLSTNNTLTITAGRTTSTGTVTIRANDNDVDTPDKMVRVSGSAGNSQGVTDPADVTLTITDDDSAPTVTLELSDDSISEDAGASTVTAKLNRASSERTTVAITATPVDPAVEKDFRLSANTTLTITAGQTTSTGTVTIRANDNDVDTPDKTVRVSGTAGNSQGVTDPSDVRLTITDDDAAPVMTLEVSPAVMAEAAGSSTVTVRITNGVTFAEAQEIRLSFSGTAEKGTDYRVESERLTLTAGESSVTTPVTSVDDEVVDVDETILITATHDHNAVGTQQMITITDDDAAPVVTTTSPLLVEENETAVATLMATDTDDRLEDLEWEIAGGTDRSKFTLTAGGELAFKVAKDYENPDDANRDGDYEITVRVSDGANRAEADFIVRLQDVDDIAPEFSAAVADGSTLTLAYSEALDSSSVPGTDAFTVTGGNATRTVSGVRVIGSAVELTLDPAVEHGQTGIRVSYTVPTGTGATPIQDTAGNDADSFNNRQVSNNTGDTTGPAVETVSITSNPGSDATYAAGETIQATVTFDETVVVTGRPRLTLKVGGRDRTADYQSVTGGAVRFEYQVVAGDSDPDGVSIEANRLSRGGGTIRDGSQNDAVLEHDALADNTQHKVDGVAPVLVDPDAAVVNGATLTLTYDEALNGSSRPATSAYTVSGGSETPTVTRVRVNESAVMLTLVPAVEHGETDLRVSYRPGANPIQDLVGNEAGVLTDREVDNRTPDTTAPSIEGIELTSDPGNDETYAAGEVIAVRVRYNEPVRVDTTGGTPTLNLTVGNRSKTAGARSGPESTEVVFVYEVERGEVDEDGVSIARGRISLNGGTIRDDGNNNAALSHDGLTADSGHRVDGVEPKLQSATVHASRLALSYDEALDEASTSTPAALDFTVTVAGNDRPVIQVRVSGNAVTLRLSSPVTAGETVNSELYARVQPDPGPGGQCGGGVDG